jgi:uncharacterized protein YkwD
MRHDLAANRRSATRLPWLAVPWLVFGCAAASAENLLLVEDHPVRGGAVEDADDATALERLVHAEVNRARAAQGLGPLAWDPALLAPARDHSRDMVARGYFAHASPEGERFGDRYERHGVQCRVLIRRLPGGGQRFATGGENLARYPMARGIATDHRGQRTYVGLRTPAQLARDVVDGWMHSPGHRANILRPHWRGEAIGVAVDGQGYVLVTQVFC